MFEVLCKGKMSYAKRVLVGHMSSYVTEFVQWEGVKAALSPVVQPHRHLFLGYNGNHKAERPNVYH